MAGLLILTVFNSRIGLFGEQADTAKKDIGCQKYNKRYVQGGNPESITGQCSSGPQLQKKRNVYQALGD
ncbi:MAG: hypothetical protein ABEJ56_01305 [Candidatus Nanohaloarchaea archaeon]